MAVTPKAVKSVPPKARATKAAKPATAAKPRASKPAAVVPAKPAAVVVLAPSKPAAVKVPSEAAGATLKKKDLIDMVTATTGAKKPLVRDIIEATLAVLGDALSKGTTLIVPPFGKAKVSRSSDAGSGKPMTVKLRRDAAGGVRRAGPNSAAAKAKQSLADDQD